MSPSPTAAQTSTVSIRPDAPTSVLGLQVLTVDAASALLLDGSLDGRFAAVAGYWYTAALPCAYQPHIAPLAEHCAFGVLVDERVDNPFSAGYSAESVRGRISPAIVAESAASISIGASGSYLVAVIHAADGRLWQCSADERSFCQRRPVFDRVVWAEGQEVDPAQFLPDVATTRSFDSAVAAATASGMGPAALAYPIDAAHLQDVDPRFSGSAQGLVWYVRAIAGGPEPSGAAPGVDVLIDDATGELLSFLTVEVNLDDAVARLVLDSDSWDGSGNALPAYTISVGDKVIAAGSLDSSSAPLALNPRDYTVHAFIDTPQANPVAGPTCDLALTVAAGDDVAYYADFTGSGDCSWKAGSLFP